MALIGIVGQAGHGKDTIGTILKEKHGFHTYALATPLKEGICKTVFGLSDEQLYTQLGKEKKDEFWGCSAREIMQFVGTELFREQMCRIMPHVGKEFWLQVFRKWRKDLFLKLKYLPNVVVTDVRFQNEADFIKKYGGKIWRVQRDFGVHTDFLQESTRQHSSEIEQLNIQGVDEVIMNDGTIEDLEDKIKKLIEIN